MTETHFYLRLLLTTIIGVSFVYVMLKLSRRNSSLDAKTPLWLKILGWIFVVFGLLSGIVVIGGLSVLEYPMVSEEGFSGIVRPSSAKLYWGYPSVEQNTILSSCMNVFLMLAFGIYFIKFRASNIKWWKKIIKVISFIVMYVLMCSVTNLHYFDWMEIWPFVLLVIIIYLNFYLANKRSDIPPPLIDTNVDVLEKNNLREDKNIIFEVEDVEL